MSSRMSCGDDAPQGGCSSLAHITQSGCAPPSPKRWDSKQRPPRAPLAPARHRRGVGPTRPQHGAPGAVQATSNGDYIVAPETMRGRKTQLQSPTRNPAVMERSTQSSAQCGFGCQCNPLWWSGMLMSPACFPEWSLEGCPRVGGPTAQHTYPDTLGRPHALPPQAQADFGGYNPLVHPYCLPSRAKPLLYPPCPPPTASCPSGCRAQCHHSSTGGKVDTSVPRQTGVSPWDGALLGAPLPLHHLPAPPCWALLLHGGCSVAWLGVGAVLRHPPQQPPPL